MFYKTANQCYKKALSDIQSNNLGSAIDWLIKAINKKNVDEYRHVLACCLFDTGQQDEAFDIWNDLIYSSKYYPSIQTVDQIICNTAVKEYDGNNFYETEDLLLRVVAEPFEVNANKVYLISMSQLKQSKFQEGWENMEIAAEMGHNDAQKLLKRKQEQNNYSVDVNESNSPDYGKWMQRIGKYAAMGTVFALTGQISGSLFD